MSHPPVHLFPEAQPPSPPTIPGELGTPRGTPWHMPIGIIGIVLAAGGLCWSAYRVVWARSVVAIGKSLKAELNPFEAEERFSGATMVVNSFGVILAVLLLVAAIGILIRRHWAVSTAITWSILKILCAVGLCTVSALIQKAQIASLRTSAGMSTASSPSSGVLSGVGSTLAIGTAFFVFLWFAASPIFVLTWFTRPAVKAEVASWRTPPVS